jgi:hypothetical protein
VLDRGAGASDAALIRGAFDLDDRIRSLEEDLDPLQLATSRGLVHDLLAVTPQIHLIPAGPTM